MQFNLDNTPDSYTIRSYSPGKALINLPVYMIQSNDDADADLPAPTRISQITITRSAIVTSHRLIDDWPPQTLDEIGARHIDTLAELGPEIVLLGCGERLRWPDPALTAPLLERGIGVEIMDTGAACRTFNILISERRNVAAALLL
jgi:uncharacterized protein